MCAWNVASATGLPLSPRRPHQAGLATGERGALTAFRFLVIEVDDRQAVDAEGGGDLAAVVDVVLEDTPDDRLE